MFLYSCVQHRVGAMSEAYKKVEETGEHQQELVAESLWGAIPSARIMQAYHAHRAQLGLVSIAGE